ncbi:hypothetical protein [Bradyrhizobium sp. USDA 329]
MGKLTKQEHGLVGVALVDLQQQGYSLPEILKVCRRFRQRLLREDDRS